MIRRDRTAAGETRARRAAVRYSCGTAIESSRAPRDRTTARRAAARRSRQVLVWYRSREFEGSARDPAPTAAVSSARSLGARHGAAISSARSNRRRRAAARRGRQVLVWYRSREFEGLARGPAPTAAVNSARTARRDHQVLVWYPAECETRRRSRPSTRRDRSARDTAPPSAWRDRTAAGELRVRRATVRYWCGTAIENSRVRRDRTATGELRARRGRQVLVWYREFEHSARDLAPTAAVNSARTARRGRQVLVWYRSRVRDPAPIAAATRRDRSARDTAPSSAGERSHRRREAAGSAHDRQVLVWYRHRELEGAIAPPPASCGSASRQVLVW